MKPRVLVFVRDGVAQVVTDQPEAVEIITLDADTDGESETIHVVGVGQVAVDFGAIYWPEFDLDPDPVWNAASQLRAIPKCAECGRPCSRSNAGDWLCFNSSCALYGRTR